MTLAPGTRLGSYEVLSLIGSGGMGQVYRARDGRLNRQVALKAIHAGSDAHLARDLSARFAREARILAALNHPNIAAVYGFEEHDGIAILVMELIDGATLADLLSGGPLPIGEALRIARQIADALDAAHERDIIHRDLKPANIKVRDDGSVKVLDFGLARMADGSNEGDTLSSANTLAGAMTTPGVVLGTVPYMSPEQARGTTVDKRTDIWAFGCVLFEMLSGTRAFSAATPTDILAAIVSRDPDWSQLPAGTPAGVRQLLRRCLTREVKGRLRDIGDVPAYLDDIAQSGTVAPPVTRAATRRLPWAIAAALAIVSVAGFALVWRAPRANTPAEIVRLSLTSPGQFNTQPPAAVISPDGRAVAFIAADDSGRGVLWVRELHAQEPRALAGTAGADQPTWSPDSKSIAFIADSALKVVPVEGGAVRTLASVGVVPGLTWNQQGTILFGKGGNGVMSIAASGGALSSRSGPTAGPVMWPHFLPDGRHYLFYSPNLESKHGVYVGTIDSTEHRRLLDSDYEAIYAAPGYLLFVRDETLLAQPFDADRLELHGEAVPIATNVWVARGYGHGVFSASANGVLSYVNAAIGNTQLTWFDRRGRNLGPLGPAGRYDSPPQIAPSGDVVAVARGPFFQQDIWLLRSDNETRFTFDSGSRVPVWFRDGRQILYQSGPAPSKLFAKHADGSGTSEPIGNVTAWNLQDITPDGQQAVYMTIGARGRFELWVAPMGGGTPVPFLQTAFNNGQAQVSPDGHWIAYTSNESGREQVYVQAFPVAGSKRQVSTDGGAQPRWQRNGKELYFLAPDHTLMSAPLKGMAPIDIGRPEPLFRAPLEYLALQGPYFMPGYDVTADGERFVINAPPAQGVAPVDIVLNWQSAIGR